MTDEITIPPEQTAAIRRQLLAANKRLVALEREGRELRELIARLASQLKGEGQPLYAQRTLDAPPVTWAHRMCLEPLPPSAEEIEAQAAALKAWAEELRKALAVIERLRADTGPA